MEKTSHIGYLQKEWLHKGQRVEQPSVINHHAATSQRQGGIGNLFDKYLLHQISLHVC